MCEAERTQLSTIRAMSVKKPQLAGFFSTYNRYNFFNAKGSTAWLYDCTHHHPTLFIAEQKYDKG